MPRVYRSLSINSPYTEQTSINFPAPTNTTPMTHHRSPSPRWTTGSAAPFAARAARPTSTASRSSSTTGPSECLYICVCVYVEGRWPSSDPACVLLVLLRRTHVNCFAQFVENGAKSVMPALTKLNRKHVCVAMLQGCSVWLWGDVTACVLWVLLGRTHVDC